MTGNMTPLLILGAIVLGTLAWKGYIPIPSLKRRPANAALKPPESHVVHGEVTPSEAWLLERLDSNTLGVYFALAKRRESEAKIAQAIAAEAAASIEQRFTAPFSPPGEGDDAGSGGA